MKSRIIAAIIGLILMAVDAEAQTGNSLTIPDIAARLGSTVSLPVVMENAAEVVAVQFTIEVPEGVTLFPQQVTKSERLEKHTVSVREVSHGKYTFIILSADNEPIHGYAGQLFNIAMEIGTQLYEGHTYPLTITEAVISLRTGENVLDETNNGKLTIKGGPNLHVTSLDCSNPVAGKMLTVKWTVRNDGHDDTGHTEWKDYLWLVPNISVGTSMEGTKLLATVDNISALAAGESYENALNVTLPERIYGNYDLVVTSNMYGVNNIDFSGTGGEPPIPYQPEAAGYGFLKGNGNARYVTLVEENESDGKSDNFFYKRIYISVPPLPDIQIPGVVVNVDNSDYTEVAGGGFAYNGNGGDYYAMGAVLVSGLASTTAFYSGKKVKVAATIENKGTADIAPTTIRNMMFISSTPDMSGGKAILLSSGNSRISLKAGESVPAVFTGYIPIDWYGDTYFIVKADVDDAVYELANTENNIGVSPKVDVLLTPGADFEPYDLNVPTQISSGTPFNIKYSVRNIGPGVPYVSTWKDKVYISPENTGLDDSAICIAELSRTGSYKSDGSSETLIADAARYIGDAYVNSQTIVLNHHLASGTYYIYVKIDANNDVFEYDGEYNNVIQSQPITLAEPDLTVELLSVSEDTLITGDMVAVSWKLHNIGDADIVRATVCDGFYVSSSANGSDAYKMADVMNTVSIVAGGEKVLRANVTVPTNKVLNGARYFFVRTNINNAVAESNTSNNSSTGIKKTFEYMDGISKVNGMNLFVGSLLAVDHATLGETIALTYTITNNGTLTIDKNVKQEVFLSKSKSFDDSARPCSIAGTQPAVLGLKSGESVTASLQVTLPADMIGGQNYLYIVINWDGALAEKKTEDNRAKTPIYINGNLPNLAVSELVAPQTIMTSTHTEVSWTVTNVGSWDSEGSTCALYLSTDSKWGNDDERLALLPVGKLAKGVSETMKASFVLDDNVVGNYYLIVKAELPDDNEELTTDDNIVFSAFSAKQSPLPDLVFSDLSYEGLLRGGQTVTIKGKVTNIGDDATHKDKWTDVFYLAEGYTLNLGKAIRLGSKTHVGKLEKDGAYEICATLNIPTDVKGYFVLFAVADGTNALVEKMKSNNQAKESVYVQDKYDTPADLAVRTFSAPAHIMAGEPVTVSYTVVNNGEYAANGMLRDVLYMSKDNLWGKDDVMVGVVNGEISLEPGNEIVRTVTGRITNMPEGSYYLIVRTNSTHAIAETNYDNNLTAQSSASNVEFARLSLGSSVTVNTSGMYKLPLYGGVEGKTVGLYLSSPKNTSAGIYESYENVPSTARYDRSASDIEATEQEVLIPDVQEGVYYILAQDNAATSRNLNVFSVDGEQEKQETVMTLTAREVQFGATTLSIREGGSNGWLSTEIHGALLDSIMDFRLVRDGDMIPTESITFYDQTSSKATFNLNDAETGTYDVVSELPNGTQATLPDGFKVVPGINVNLGVKIDAPHWTHVDSPVPVTIAYANGGNTDIIIRGLLFNCDAGNVGMTIEDLQKHEHTLSFKPKGMSDNRGFITIPPGTQETIRCYFKQTDIGLCYLRVYVIK